MKCTECFKELNEGEKFEMTLHNFIAEQSQAKHL